MDQITFDFFDGGGAVLTSDALPADAPDMQAFSNGTMWVRGGLWGGMEVRVQIESAELVPPAIEVSPAAGKFLSQQRFDAAVLLPVGSQVASMQASVNGNPVALNFPGTCPSEGGVGPYVRRSCDQDGRCGSFSCARLYPAVSPADCVLFHLF